MHKMHDARCVITDDFMGAPSTHWARWLQGTGRLELGDSTVRLVTSDARAGQYSDAQLDDYHTSLPDSGTSPDLKRRWLWHPPLQMQVRARASGGSLVGTAGFGFWNDPFTLSGGVTALPEAVWFFYASPPSDMALVPGVPGWGWQAAVVHAARPDVVLAALPTAITVLWARLTGRTHTAARWVQRLSGAHIAPLRLDWTEWHTFGLDWLPDEAVFGVDGASALRAPNPPRGPLGFVTWVDNQFAVATPRGQFHFGTLDAPEKQWLELDWICIEG